MVSIVFINYNGEKLLKGAIESVINLDFKDKEIIIIDNASTDGSVALIKENFPNVKIAANKKNSGYAGAADQAVRVSTGEFIMILNPDIIFEKDYLEILVEKMKSDAHIGAIIGKLRKYDFNKHEKTDLIDSAGLLMFKNRRCVDRGQGEADRGQYDKAEEVFGITGACPLYRRKALESSCIGGEYFDTDFFMYKEDVDISWRMRLFGWKCFYEPAAVAYHGRGTGALNRSGLFDVARHRMELSPFQKFYSYKNERLMRVKNELCANVLRDFPHIFFKEFLMFGWMIVKERFLFKAFLKFCLQLPRALKKRGEIMRKKKVQAEDMGKWFV